MVLRLNRVEQNYAFIEVTVDDLDNRTAGFHYAIDRAKLETPAAMTGSVDNSLSHLRERAHALRYEITEFHDASKSNFGQMKPPLLPIPPYTASPARSGIAKPSRVNAPSGLKSAAAWPLVEPAGVPNLGRSGAPFEHVSC